MKKNTQLQKDVMEELKSEPRAESRLGTRMLRSTARSRGWPREPSCPHHGRLPKVAQDSHEVATEKGRGQSQAPAVVPARLALSRENPRRINTRSAQVVGITCS